ncbi:MAG TPA: deoxyribonuclease IV [Longimicrobiales bacterium]
MNRSRDELGAHVSAAGGVRHAPGRAAALESCVLQVFTKMPGRWAEPVLDDAETAAFRAAVREHGISAMSAHDSYLINLASPDPVLRARSFDSFARELDRCTQLGIPLIVSHPGNATDGDFPSALARNAEAVQRALEESAGVSILFETTAGAGRVLGARFDELARLIDRIPAGLHDRVGVCVDTCHIWAAGYDIRNDYDGVIRRFDDTLGLDRLRLFHLNDCRGPLDARLDRHAAIGEGALGDAPFARLLNDDRLHHVPKLLETPKDGAALTADRRNLARLRAYRSPPAATGNKSPKSRNKYPKSARGATRGDR